MIKFSDEFLPTQDEYQRLRIDAPSHVVDPRLFDLICGVSEITHPANELDLEFPADFTAEMMSSNPISLRFLQMLIRMIDATNVLEIGTFVGISAMHFAKVLPAHGFVTTVEKGHEFAELARRNIEANGFSKKIRVAEADAIEWLHRIGPPSAMPMRYDFAFIDGDKARYPLIFALVEPWVRSGGIIVVDDVLFHGDVLNSWPTTDKGRGCAEMLGSAQRLPWQKLLLPLANGMLIMVKP